MTVPVGAPAAARFVDAHRDTLRQALTAISERGYWSAYPESQPQGVRGRGRGGRQGGVRGAPRQAVRAGPGRHRRLGRRGALAVRAGARRHLPAADLDALLGAARAGMPAWRDAGPEARAAVCLEILSADQRPQPRDRARRHAHQRPGLRDGLPGRRPARPGPGAGGGGLRVRRADPARRRPPAGRSRRASGRRCGWTKTFTVVPRGDRAGDRLQHLPDLELLPRPVRAPGHRQRGAW